MPLDVTLGSLTWRWQLKDDRAVDDWLSHRPWLGSGGLLVVQAPNDHDVTPQALRRGIFAADARLSEVRVVSLGEDNEAPLLELLGLWLGIPQRRDRDVVLALADDLDARPAVFLLDARRSSTASPWSEQAASLLDLASKLEVDRLPTFIVLHRRGHAPLRGRYDLDRGWPIGLARSLLDVPDDALWPKYVHLRFAWESGGVVEDGVECSAIAGDMPFDDDEDLERVLNSFAEAKFDLLPNVERTAWTQIIAAPRANRGAPTVFGRSEDTDGRLTPFPWMARALLLRGAAGRSTVRALRAEMNCRPLSEQVLNRCFAVEASLRGRLPNNLPAPPEDLRSAYDRFAARGALGPSLVSELYPTSHPSPPTDGWDFASVGKVAEHVPATEAAEWRLFSRMRILRNAVAHCHYIGWRGLQEARAIRGLLS